MTEACEKFAHRSGLTALRPDRRVRLHGAAAQARALGWARSANTGSRACSRTATRFSTAAVSKPGSTVPRDAGSADGHAEGGADLRVCWCGLCSEHPEQRAVSRRESVEGSLHGDSVRLSFQPLVGVRSVAGQIRQFIGTRDQARRAAEQAQALSSWGYGQHKPKRCNSRLVTMSANCGPVVVATLAGRVASAA
jgi:hypothetical protein